MNKSLVLKNKFYLFFSFIFAFFLFLYLINVLINGPRGVFAYFKYKNLNIKQTQELSYLNKKNAILLDRIERLQPNTLDIDYLEEKLRQNTGFMKDNEILVVFD